MHIILTQHAKVRLRERCNLKKSDAQKFVDNAFKKGIRHADTKDSLNRYLNHLYFRYGKANNIRIYKDIIFIQRKNILFTILHLPEKYKEDAKLYERRGKP